MLYRVEKIEEDLDFGCEERSESDPATAIVTLRAEQGEKRVVRVPDRFLYEEKIEEDVWVNLSESGQIQKAREQRGGAA